MRLQTSTSWTVHCLNGFLTSWKPCFKALQLLSLSPSYRPASLLPAPVPMLADFQHQCLLACCQPPHLCWLAASLLASCSTPQRLLHSTTGPPPNLLGLPSAVWPTPAPEAQSAAWLLSQCLHAVVLSDGVPSLLSAPSPTLEGFFPCCRPPAWSSEWVHPLHLPLAPGSTSALSPGLSACPPMQWRF